MFGIPKSATKNSRPYQQTAELRKDSYHTARSTSNLKYCGPYQHTRQRYSFFGSVVINHLRHSIRIRTKPAHIKPTRNSQPLPIRGTKPQYSRTVQPQPIVQPSVPDSTMIAHSTIAAPTPHQALTDSMTSQTSKQDRAATLLSAAEETAFAKIHTQPFKQKIIIRSIDGQPPNYPSNSISQESEVFKKPFRCRVIDGKPIDYESTSIHHRVHTRASLRSIHRGAAVCANNERERMLAGQRDVASLGPRASMTSRKNGWVFLGTTEMGQTQRGGASAGYHDITLVMRYSDTMASMNSVWSG